eukprot:TRINITY_DN15117_c0_g1_i1.p1 TRINITY_DN15117_c0_g1~~TRINITY_DN15117_c0_g1_i1.p1  ORF type:complete len:324 (+),score=39.94 TRINITY_DN15117_c0_g1_i1:538-1509(+)
MGRARIPPPLQERSSQTRSGAIRFDAKTTIAFLFGKTAAAAVARAKFPDSEWCDQLEGKRAPCHKIVESYAELSEHVRVLLRSSIEREVVSISDAADLAVSLSDSLSRLGSALTFRLAVAWTDASLVSVGEPAVKHLYRWDLCCQRWDVLLSLLIQLHSKLAASGERRPLRYVEVGAANALTSLYLLERLPWLEAILVDPYDLAADTQATGRSAPDLRQERMEVEAKLQPYRARARLIHDFSLSAAREINDRSADLIFVDGDHRKDAVLNDLMTWERKVRPTGILAGHDYSMSFWGTAMAVHHFAPQAMLQHAGDAVYFYEFR